MFKILNTLYVCFLMIKCYVLYVLVFIYNFFVYAGVPAITAYRKILEIRMWLYWFPAINPYSFPFNIITEQIDKLFFFVDSVMYYTFLGARFTPFITALFFDFLLLVFNGLRPIGWDEIVTLSINTRPGRFY